MDDGPKMVLFAVTVIWFFPRGNGLLPIYQNVYASDHVCCLVYLRACTDVFQWSQRKILACRLVDDFSWIVYAVLLCDLQLLGRFAICALAPAEKRNQALPAVWFWRVDECRTDGTAISVCYSAGHWVGNQQRGQRGHAQFV